MDSKSFVIWLKGFSKAANEYNITPKQWDTIVDELNKVKDKNDQYETNYDPWHNPQQYNYGVTSSNTATALQFPKGTIATYISNQKKKQQLND